MESGGKDMEKCDFFCTIIIIFNNVFGKAKKVQTTIRPR